MAEDIKPYSSVAQLVEYPAVNRRVAGAEPATGAKHPDIDDDGELNNKYRHKKGNGKRQSHLCLLSFDEYAQLAREAGIKSSDIGPGGFHLARLGDRGHYQIGNCRFIPYLENLAERAPIDRAKLSAGVLRWLEENGNHWIGREHRDETKRKIGKANAVAQAGSRNSQFGTAWVTRMGENKKIRKEEIEAYKADGWRRGRSL